MTTTYIQPGNVVTLTAPTGGVTAGVPKLIGNLLVVPQNTVAQGLPFDGHVLGQHLLPKATGQTWAEGANLYWDNTAGNFTTTATANYYAGVAAAAAASGDTTGYVLLNGIGIKATG